MKTKNESRTITFQPTATVRSLIRKAMTRRQGVPRSRVINEAIIAAFEAAYSGKRENSR